jgi:hypothetical protein
MSNRVRGTSTTAEWDAERAEIKSEAAGVVKSNAEAAAEARKAFENRNAVPATTSAYADQTKDQLSAELERRGLPHSGNKDELIARLEESD